MATEARKEKQTQTRAALQKPTEEWRKGLGLLKAARSGEPDGRGPAARGERCPLPQARCGERSLQAPHVSTRRDAMLWSLALISTGEIKKKSVYAAGWRLTNN